MGHTARSQAGDNHAVMRKGIQTVTCHSSDTVHGLRIAAQIQVFLREGSHCNADAAGTGTGCACNQGGGSAEGYQGITAQVCKRINQGLETGGRFDNIAEAYNGCSVHDDDTGTLDTVIQILNLGGSSIPVQYADQSRRNQKCDIDIEAVQQNQQDNHGHNGSPGPDQFHLLEGFHLFSNIGSDNKAIVILGSLAELVLQIDDTQDSTQNTGGNTHSSASHGAGAQILSGQNVQDGGGAREDCALECDRSIDHSRDQPSGQIVLLEHAEENGVGDEHESPAVNADEAQNGNCEHTAVDRTTSAQALIDHLGETGSSTRFFHYDSKNVTGGKQKEVSHQEVSKTGKPDALTASANEYTVKPERPLNSISDIQGYNLYYGWYYGEFDELADFFDDYHAKRPENPIGISEYGVDARLDLHKQVPEKQDYSEEYQCAFHEAAYPIIRAREYVWGSFIWNMFDFSSPYRGFQPLLGLNRKGLVTFDRQNRKDVFYYYQAWWSEKPMLYLCERRYEKRVEDTAVIKVYSNQKEVALIVNGECIGTLTGDKVFRFENVKLMDGANTITAVSGNLTDTMVIQKVSTPEESYIFVDPRTGGSARDWVKRKDEKK